MEDAYIVNGGKKLKGTIELSGAKNVALKVIIAALLFNQEVIFKNIPRINDVFELFNLINSLGGKAEFIEKNTVLVDGRLINKNKVDLLYGSKIRVSFMFFAPLLYKFKSCYVPNPGGCRIGARPIDRIIDGMRQLGVKVEYNSNTGYYKAHVDGKSSACYSFQKPSHTGTELLILISVLGNNKVTIGNPALEPEIDDLINFLNQSGANIKQTDEKIVINPAKKLSRSEPYSIIYDRNEAVTYASLALATKGEVVIDNISPLLIKSYLEELKKIGAGADYLNNDRFKFYYKGLITSSNIETSPYPGFMTDWQPNWAVLMTQAKGESIIHERVFENRFSYIEELEKLGAKIDLVDLVVRDPDKFYFFNYGKGKHYQQAIKIYGPQELHNGVLQIADLRAGATLAIAALIASGKSVVYGASILERGYENFVEKVQSLGGRIKKV